MNNFLRIIFCVQICLSLAQKGPCDESYNGCCSGTRWNSSLSKCIVCLPGYLGENCSELCEYPRYGMMCMNTCNCDRSSCDFMTGCLTQDISTMTESAISDKIGTFPMTTAFNNNNASSFPFTTKPKSILTSLIIAVGSTGIGICFLYVFVYVFQKTKYNETPQSPDNAKKNEDDLYQEIYINAAERKI